mgnify:CR=1 FL=1
MTHCNEFGEPSPGKTYVIDRGRSMPSAIDHVRTGLAVALGTAFTWIGIQHFVDVNWFVPIVPAILGWPEFWVYVSGAAEILLGLGLILPSTRARAGRWTARFLLLVYWPISICGSMTFQ